MVKFPKEIKDLSHLEIRPFEDRKEVIINHLEMVTRRLIEDLRNNITTHSGKKCHVSVGMSTDSLDIASTKMKDGSYFLYLQGPHLQRLYDECIDKYDDLYIKDPVTGLTRVYALRTAFKAQYTIVGLADIIENLLSDLHLYFTYNTLMSVNGQTVQIWNYQVDDNVMQPYYFSNVRPIYIMLDLLPIYLYNIYSYEETDAISNTIVNLNMKSASGIHDDNKIIIKIKGDN